MASSHGAMRHQKTLRQDVDFLSFSLVKPELFSVRFHFIPKIINFGV
jgi:hypothetical protein